VATGSRSQGPFRTDIDFTADGGINDPITRPLLHNVALLVVTTTSPRLTVKLMLSTASRAPHRFVTARTSSIGQLRELRQRQARTCLRYEINTVMAAKSAAPPTTAPSASCFNTRPVRAMTIPRPTIA
jgi:hypothetical protein